MVIRAFIPLGVIQRGTGVDCCFDPTTRGLGVGGIKLRTTTPWYKYLSVERLGYNYELQRIWLSTLPLINHKGGFNQLAGDHVVWCGMYRVVDVSNEQISELYSFCSAKTATLFHREYNPEFDSNKELTTLLGLKLSNSKVSLPRSITDLSTCNIPLMMNLIFLINKGELSEAIRWLSEHKSWCMQRMLLPSLHEAPTSWLHLRQLLISSDVQCDPISSDTLSVSRVIYIDNNDWVNTSDPNVVLNKDVVLSIVSVVTGQSGEAYYIKGGSDQTYYNTFNKQIELLLNQFTSHIKRSTRIMITKTYDENVDIVLGEYPGDSVYTIDLGMFGLCSPTLFTAHHR